MGDLATMESMLALGAAGAADLGASLVIVGTGFAVVLAVLLVLFVATTVQGIIFSRLVRTPTAKPTPAAGVLAPVAADGLDERTRQHHKVVIAAAVATSLPEPHRIVSARPVSTDWSREGRRSHFESHKLR